jgi:intracellular septation protein A
MTSVAEPPVAGRWTRARTRRAVMVGLRVAVGLAVPTALYYLLRALGQSVYVALVVSTVLSAVPSLYSLVRYRRVDGLSLYFTVMMLGGLAVSLVPGSTRFLLAREAVMTGVTGVWFIASIATSRPLAYQFTRPLVEGRLRWPDHWEELWQVSPLFRRLWRVSSLVWGLGTLGDAAVRVVLAYTVRPDLVPALGLALYVATVVVINVVLNVYYILSRVHDPRSPIRRGLVAQDAEPAGTS